MIARRRGEHDGRRGRWRPGSERYPAQVSPHQLDACAPVGFSLPGVGFLGRRGVRAVRWMIVLAAVVSACVVASWGIGMIVDGSPQPGLPRSPRAWLDAYEAAAIDDPSRVCSELFAPSLARAYGKTIHGTCRRYFRRITSYSVVVRRVLGDGSIAVLELRQTVPRSQDWAVVLSRRDGGWRAVDLVTGRLLR